jgi:hypothetical protein
MQAEAWIDTHALSGTLMRYAVDVSAYDWATANGVFVPLRDEHKRAEFIESFSSTRQEHRHYDKGELAAA